jgi:hypothetical protein
LIASPVNEPLTFEVVAFVAAGVGDADVELFDELLEDELDELEEDVELDVADFVAVDVDFFEVAFLVATAEADAVAVGEAVVTAAELDELDPDNEVAAEAPAIVESPLFPNCGGVTDKTAPRPPTVPPAISNTRFMPNLVFLTLEQNQ